MNALVTIFLVPLVLVCFYKLQSADPGRLPPHKGELKESQKLCTKCNALKIAKSHHCSRCNGCIKQMDHHCIFIMQCIGAGNIRYFVQFAFYMEILLVYGALL
jgi:palmitoyltransferase ZDHHC2/15/20